MHVLQTNLVVMDGEQLSPQESPYWRLPQGQDWALGVGQGAGGQGQGMLLHDGHVGHDPTTGVGCGGNKG